jgi:predicted nucleic acid-binding Zn ribbon protein
MYVPEHSHCKYCGDPIPFGQEYCDDTCKGLFEAEKSTEKKKDIIFYAEIVISLVVILFIGSIIKFFA